MWCILKVSWYLRKFFLNGFTFYFPSKKSTKNYLFLVPLKKNTICWKFINDYGRPSISKFGKYSISFSSMSFIRRLLYEIYGISTKNAIVVIDNRHTSFPFPWFRPNFSFRPRKLYHIFLKIQWDLPKKYIHSYLKFRFLFCLFGNS